MKIHVRKYIRPIFMGLDSDAFLKEKLDDHDRALRRLPQTTVMHA